MKTLTNIILKATVLTTIVAFFFVSCNEEDPANKPSVTTVSTADITFSSVTISANIASNGGSKIIAKGICYGTTTAPTVEGDTTNQGEGNENFVSHLSDLTPNTTYYVRAYATNAVGTSYGEELSFTTQTGLAEVTLTVTEITYKKASVSLSITFSGASDITNSGFVYSSENSVPTIMDIMWPTGSSELNIQHYLTELTIGTTYYVRAFAQNAQGMAYSNVVEITTLSIPEATDIDGNTYGTVVIGDNAWMTENLKVTKFSNGDAIPTTVNATNNEVAPIYQWVYNDDDANLNFGRLYTWYVATDSRNVCPTGWHVPNYEELNTLRESAYALREVGTTSWNNNSGTNTTGFSAKGSGIRDIFGTYAHLKNTFALQSTDVDPGNSDNFSAIVLGVYYADDVPFYGGYKNMGTSIRCVADKE